MKGCYAWDAAAKDWQAADDRMDERALAYGDGFFSTLGVCVGQILWRPWHLTRLNYSAQAFWIDLKAEDIMAALDAVAARMGEGILKIIVSRRTQAVRGYGFLPTEDGRAPKIWIKAMPSPSGRVVCAE